MKIAPFKLERYFAQYEFKAPYLLSSSDCESLSIAELLAYEPGAAERFQQHWLGYTETQGSPELRREISGLYEHISDEQVLVVNSAEEAIFLFMNAALEAGDHIIVHAPGYQSHYEIARSLGAEVTLWTTEDSDGWELDLEALQEAIRPNTRAILVNCPHNPTGYLMSAEKLHQIIEIAQNHNLIVFSDEVYRCLEHEAGTTLPAACDLDERAVSVGALSKTYGMAGLRIGWIATRNRAVYQQMLVLKDYTTICNSAPSEFLSCVALRNRVAIAQRNLTIIRANLDLLDEFFARHADTFDWRRPKAGSTAFPRLKNGLSSAAFCHAVVEAQGVMLLPSTCFDYGDAHFRIGYGRRNMPDALHQLENGLLLRAK